VRKGLSPKPTQPLDQANAAQRKPHPGVYRRRKIWLAVMIFMIAWSLIEIVFQQNRIWHKEQVIRAKQAELARTQEQTQMLKKEIQKLNDHDYLMELAHKFGYGKKGETIIHVESEPTSSRP
jgi:cell division protein FtsB